MNASLHVAISSMRRRGFFGGVVSTSRPSSNNCGSGSEFTKLVANNSAKSTNLPLRICVTTLVGTGEKPGPTTNGLSAKALTFVEGRLVAMPLKACADDDASAGTGALNVDTKVGTTTEAFLP